MRKTFLLSYLKIFKQLNTPARIIRFAFKRHSKEPYIVQPDKDANYRFCDVEDRAEKLAHFLYWKALNRGDTVAFYASNCFEYFEIRTAVHLSGFILLGLPLHLAIEDLIYFLTQTNTKVIFYRASERPDLDCERIKHEAGVKYIIDLDSPVYTAIFEKSLAGHKANYKPYPMASYNVSSGTTKKTPKIVQITGDQWVASLYNYVLNADISQVNKKIIFLSALPFVTAGSTTFLPTMFAGVMHVVVGGSFSAHTIALAIKQHKVNRLYITPSWLMELVAWCKHHQEPLESLDTIIVGTERLLPAHFKEAIDFFGPKLTIGYGMVEVLPPLTLLSPQDYFSHWKQREHLFSSSGKVLNGVTIAIVDEHGRPVKRGTIGAITIKSATISQGYLDNEQDTAASFKSGWFHSGDYGYFDEDNFLFIVGRQTDIIAKNTQGKPVFACELEDQISTLSYVRQCCVLTKDSRIFVFVSLSSGVSVDAQQAQRMIAEFCKSKLPSYLVPARVIMKESLPISPLGKLDKKSLASEQHA